MSAYDKARAALYRALSGNCSHDLREALISDFEAAVIARHEAGETDD